MLSSKLLEKYLERFDELILDGENIYDQINYLNDEPQAYMSLHLLNGEHIIQWKTHCIILLHKLIENNFSIKIIDDLQRIVSWKDGSLIKICVAQLKSIKENV